MKIKVSLSPSSIDAAIKQLEDYSKDLDRKAQELCKRLTDMGATSAKLSFSKLYYEYKGPIDLSVSVEERGNNKYAIVANGETVLIAEFGAGVTLGKGHPKPEVDGIPMGPGTHPDKHYSTNSEGKRVANWENDRGWYLPKSKGGGHTFGNPPTMAMHNTGKELKAELLKVAQEVFENH